MPRLPPADPRLRLSPNLLAETWHVIRSARLARPIWFSVLGLSWFWTIGATLLTEFPVVVRDTMHAEGSVLTLLLAVFAIGVGVGSIGTAQLLHGRVSARFAPFAAFGISLFCWDFSTASSAASGIATVGGMIGTIAGWRMLADLTALAACGGVFSVPLYAIIQEAAVPDQRSRMVAANNIMNALFMVGGSGVAAGLAAAGLDAPWVLRIAAVANLLVAVWIGLRRDAFSPGRPHPP